MYVLRQNAAAQADSPTGTIYPADRCTWTQEPAPASSAPGQYGIENGFYVNHTTSVDLGDDISLGFIGKSGRFVAITT